MPFEVWFGQVGEPQNVAQRPARDLAFAEHDDRDVLASP